MINSSWCHWWRRSKNSRDKNHKKLWPTVDIARRREPEVPEQAEDRRIRGDEKAETRSAQGTLQTRAVSERGQPCGADGTKATDQGWGSGVCDTKIHRRAGIRTDQTGARIPTVPLTRVGESTRGVGADLYDSQHSEVSQALKLHRIIMQVFCTRWDACMP